MYLTRLRLREDLEVLRDKLIQDLREKLGSIKGFAPDDFVIINQAKADGTSLLTVRYRFEPQFQCIATIPATTDSDGLYDIKLSTRPGEMAVAENRRAYTWDGLIESIKQWELRVREEMKAAPLAREMEQNARELEQLLQSYATLDESYFSREEAADLAARLEELERRMAEHIHSSAANKQEEEAKLTNVHAEIQVLKETLATHSKRGWAGKALVRVHAWLKDPDNQNLLKSSAEVARILLPPGPGA
jgi:hypothetical protein